METIDRVKALVGDQVGCPASEIDAETPFKELDLDSLDRIELGMAIEEHFHLDIPDVDMENEAHGTPAGIAAYLDSRKDDWGTFTGKGAPIVPAMTETHSVDGVELQGVGFVEIMNEANANLTQLGHQMFAAAKAMVNGQPTGIEGKSMPIYGIRKADFDFLRETWATIMKTEGDLYDLPSGSCQKFTGILDGIAEDESKSRGYEV